MTTEFTAFNLRPELEQAITALGYVEPTPIQAGMIPLMLTGVDVIGQAQTGKTWTVEFNELLDNTFLAQHLHNGQNQVRRGRPWRQFAVQLEADDFGNQHDNRLAEQGGFGLNAAHAPTDNAQAINHRRMRVRTDHGIWIC